MVVVRGDMKITKEIKFLINKRMKIPSKFWSKAENGEMVCWILDREDGTADSYETSQERLGITLEGNILWGFTSGCSCWSGWEKEDYLKSLSYKEFVIYKIEDKDKRYDSSEKRDQWDFIKGWENEALETIKLIKEAIKNENTN